VALIEKNAEDAATTQPPATTPFPDLNSFVNPSNLAVPGGGVALILHLWTRRRAQTVPDRLLQPV
jgi:hypothetical protein